MKIFVPSLFCLLALAALAPAQFITDVVVRESVRPGRFRPQAITIDKHEVKVEVEDGVARTTVVQTFRNPNNMVLEGQYLFPLPDQAAVDGFKLMMGGKMVAGEVVERDKARSIYEGIVRRQQDPALLEYMGRRLFKASIFPIPARGTAVVELSYTETLRADGKLFEYRYPFKTQQISGAPVGQAIFGLSIKSNEPIRTVYSPSHEVDVVKKGDHAAKVSFERSNEPGVRDVVVLYGVSREKVGLNLFAHGEGKDEGAFLMLMAPSEDAGAELQAKDVLFVVDTSGSMAGEPMEQTKRALDYCVKSLRADDRFEIVPFSTEARSLFGSLAPASAEKKTEALSFISALTARGGTNINDALVNGLSLTHDKDRPFLVIFMTDGEPTLGETRTDAILKNVKDVNKALTRLFVFGVGDKVRTELLDLLAEENRGARDYVGNKEDIELKISSFFTKVSSPVLSDVSVAFEGVSVSEQHPKQLPDLFRGSQLLVTGRYHGAGKAKVVLKGKLNGKMVETAYDVAFESGGESTAFVPRLWAVRRVGYLMDQIRLQGQSQEVKDEVVRLGKQYGIVTPYTSYLVVEDEAPVVRESRRAAGRDGGIGAANGPGRGGATSTRGLAVGQTGGGPGSPPAPQTATPNSEPDSEELVVDRFLRKSKAPAPADDKNSQSPGKDTPAADPAGPVSGGLSHLSSEAETKKSEREKATRGRVREELGRAYDSDAITLSQQLKALREAKTGNDGAGEALVKRVGNRTFYLRNGFYVDAAVLEMTAGQIEKALVKIEVFSAEYFVLAKDKEVASILALGNNVLFRQGDRVVQLVPAAAAGGK